jgi:hypothetical protein
VSPMGVSVSLFSLAISKLECHHPTLLPIRIDSRVLFDRKSRVAAPVTSMPGISHIIMMAVATHSAALGYVARNDGSHVIRSGDEVR